MTVYGFGRDHAANLLKVSRREGLGRRRGAIAEYPDDLANAPANHVQVWTTSGSPTVGDVLEGNADNLFPGRVRFFPDGVLLTTEDCWIGFADWYDQDVSQKLYALHGKHYIARLAGTVESGGTTAPFYVATQHNFECWCKPDADIAAGDAGTVSLYNGDYSDSTINRASTAAQFMDVEQDQWCVMTRPMGTYIVQPMECPPE